MWKDLGVNFLQSLSKTSAKHDVKWRDNINKISLDMISNCMHCFNIAGS